MVAVVEVVEVTLPGKIDCSGHPGRGLSVSRCEDRFTVVELTDSAKISSS